jgi:hypothetical protein
MAKTKPAPAKSRSPKNKEMKVVSARILRGPLAILPGSFVKIFDPDGILEVFPGDEITIQAVCRFAAGSNPNAYISYVKADDDSTGSGNAVLAGNKIVGTIVLPTAGTYVVQVGLTDAGGNVIASDSVIVEVGGLGPPPPPTLPAGGGGL